MVKSCSVRVVENVWQRCVEELTHIGVHSTGHFQKEVL